MPNSMPSIKGKGFIAVLACALMVAAALGLAACGQQEQASSAASSEAASSEAASSEAASSSAAVAVEVPNVASLTQEKAQKTIEDAGLKLGSVTEKTSTDIEKGKVISQKPEAGAETEAGAKVDLVVSSGEPEPQTAAVPNVASLAQEDAQKALKDAGFKVGEVTTATSEDIEKGKVISQKPEAATEQEVGSEVSLVVSSGKPEPKMAKVPDLWGMTEADARKALEDAGFKAVASSPQETTEVEPGEVCGQSIAAGADMELGTEVQYTIAAEPTMYAVPNVVGLDENAAQKAIEGASLVYDCTEAYDDDTPQGIVMAQSIEAGKKVNAGTVVTVTASLGEDPSNYSEVPDLIGLPWSDAKELLNAYGFKAAYEGDRKGVVVYQDVDPGRTLRHGARVTVLMEEAVETVAVPNLKGLSVDDAMDELDEVGLVGKVKGGYHGTVKKQSPKVGKVVEVGSTVTITIDSSDFK